MQKHTGKITKKILIVFSVVILSSFTFLNFVFDKNDVILGLLYDSLREGHYSPPKLDDAFSEKAFDLYINTAFNKQFLLQEDIDALSKYRHDIDDEISSQRHDLYTSAQEIVNKRIKEKEEWSKEILSKPFDYTVEEEYETDYKKMKYAKSNDELKDEWRKMLKYRVLYRLDDMLNKAEKKDTVTANHKNVAKMPHGSKESVVSASEPHIEAIIDITQDKEILFDSLETDARKKTLKEQEDWFKRLNKLSTRDRFSEFANAMTGVFDPHTQYFAPREKKKFYEGMSGQFEGIGAKLQQKDGVLKVSEVIVGSPSYKQGQLKEGDDIIKVAQGAGDPVDIVNMDMEDAIDLIKGRKGTEVRLTIKRSSDNTTRVIPIIRDVIEIDDTFPRTALIENKSKLGYIYLPQFYTDFSRTGARHCSQDMRKEIEKLKKQDIKGLIVDLRDNGGGSLQEAVEMAGLFFPKGPVVQAKGKNNGPVTVMEDRNPDVAWDGPLTILINHNSASASEILAAAIQDYKRGVIIGTTSFGKGTIQTVLNLDDFLLKQFDTIKPIGSLKITQQKFYRINGGATQLKGVTPDILLPDPYAFIELGEKEYENHLPWDEIARANYTEFSTINYPKIIKNSGKRVTASSQFNLIDMQAKEVKLKKDATKYNLKLTTFREEQKQLRDQNKKYEDLRKEVKGFNAGLLEEDKIRLANDTVRLNREKKWAQNVSKDIYIHEAADVLNDMK